MRPQALVPFALCAALLLGPATAGSAGAADAEDAAQAVESLFGNDIRSVRATPDARDDVELAGRILDAARKAQGQPAFAAVLCEKAYELGCANPTGYPTAAAALELLAQAAADRAAWCAERVLDLRQRQFDAARGDEKKAAGEALLACLLPALEAKEKSGALPDAAALCRRMQTVAAATDSPRRADIDARADALAMKMKVARQIADVKAMLARDPRNVAAREGLVRLYLVEMDDPAEAAGNLEGAADEKLLKYVPAAAKGVAAAPEVACTELADWYRGLAETAPPAAKAAMYARAKEYLKRFLEVHPAQDLDRTRATLALAKIEEAAAKLSAPARPTPTPKPPAPREKPAPPVQQWIDLLALVDPARDAVLGDWSLKEGSLVMTGPGSTRLAIPVAIDGDYQLQVEFAQMRGDNEVAFILPVRSRATALLIGKDVRQRSGLFWAEKGDTMVSPAPLKMREPHALEVTVRADKGSADIDVQLDGKPYFRWQGPQGSLTVWDAYRLPDSKCAGLGAWGGEVVFKSVRLRMLSGEARPLRPPPGGATKALSPAKPAPAAQQWIDLLALVDPAKDALAGQWERQGTALAIAGGEPDRRLAVPLAVAGSYELDARLMRTAGDNAVMIALPVGAASVGLCFSVRASAASGLTRINGRGGDANETTVKDAALQNGRAYAVHVKVLVQGDNAQVEVTRDGAPFISWSGPQSALTPGWTFADSRQPGLGAWGCKVIFHSLRLRMLSGEARPLRP
ncbi:MAG: hypothetical protein FJ288_06045 [Planctomycetes bacterium]|nr:hypothetical protein [Planctomycetota bacterium]